jgi:choline dehydrogenase-like flavoprotein
MAKKLPAKDLIIVGLGWTGSILGYEMAKIGLDVVALERGPWRDTATDFPPSYAQDELRYDFRHDLFVETRQTTLTFRNRADQTALPIRRWACRPTALEERVFIGVVKRGDSFRPIFGYEVILRNGMARRFYRKT